MSSTCGENIKVTVFGQSHSAAIGMTLEGVPAGESIDMEELRAFLRRRAPGQNAWSTARKEEDIPEFLAGLKGGVSCGTPITAIIRNTDARPGDYEALHGIREVRGKRRFLGRRALLGKAHGGALHRRGDLHTDPKARGSGDHLAYSPDRAREGQGRTSLVDGGKRLSDRE